MVSIVLEAAMFICVMLGVAVIVWWIRQPKKKEEPKKPVLAPESSELVNIAHPYRISKIPGETNEQPEPSRTAVPIEPN